MKYPVFAIKDNLVGFLRPLTELNQAVAIRNFRDAFSTLPDESRADYTLYHIGEFDDVTGELAPLSPSIVVHATSFGGVENEV